MPQQASVHHVPRQLDLGKCYALSWSLLRPVRVATEGLEASQSWRLVLWPLCGANERQDLVTDV